MVIRSAALADVEDVVAADENFAEFSLLLAVYYFFGICQLHYQIDTRMFMYSSFDCKMPRSSHPHLSCTPISFPCRSCRKGSGFYMYREVDISY